MIVDKMWLGRLLNADEVACDMPEDWRGPQACPGRKIKDVGSSDGAPNLIDRLYSAEKLEPFPRNSLHGLI